MREGSAPIASCYETPLKSPPIALFWLSLTILVLTSPPARPGEEPAAPWGIIAPSFEAPEAYRDGLGDYRSPLEFYDGTPVRTPEDWLRRRSEILRTWHELMGPWPPVI